MLKYTSVFYDLMMRSWPYTCVDQWPGIVHLVRKYTSVHSRTQSIYIYIYIYIERERERGGEGEKRDQEKTPKSVKTVRTGPGRTRDARYNQGGGAFLSFYLLFFNACVTILHYFWRPRFFFFFCV
ncbi:hypothetical protein Hanom_Chr09g00838021 [Helianthus anomalus]